MALEHWLLNITPQHICLLTLAVTSPYPGLIMGRQRWLLPSVILMSDGEKTIMFSHHQVTWHAWHQERVITSSRRVVVTIPHLIDVGHIKHETIYCYHNVTSERQNFMYKNSIQKWFMFLVQLYHLGPGSLVNRIYLCKKEFMLNFVNTQQFINDYFFSSNL